MHRKNLLYVTNGLEISDIVRRVTGNLDVTIASTPLADLHKATVDGEYDLVVADLGAETMRELTQLESNLSIDDPIPFLLVVDVDMLPDLRLPVRITSDFIVRGASEEEYAARMRHLLWPGEEASDSDIIRVDNMTINLATYQVQIAGEPVDLTYLEYALLAFFVTHPNRTYSRDALLRRVWGFEYYGGSRTVDVHVRRIRAKLTPELAERLETVRGVGYLWDA